MLLTIVIPVYNSEKYVRHTLQSIFDQKFDRGNLEVIVVNDGTTDNSMEIVREFASREAGIKIIEQQNQGLSAARNTGIAAATGKYVWFVDSDDWIEEGFLEKAPPLLDKAEEDVFLFRICEYRESDGQKILERTLPHETAHETDLLELLQTRTDFSPVQLFIIRKEFMDRCHLTFVNGIIHEDMEYAPRMLILAKSIKSVPWTHYNYLRRDTGSLTSNPSNRKKRIDSLFQIIDLQRELEKGITDKRNLRAMQTVRFWLYRKLFNFISFDEFLEIQAEIRKRSAEMKALVRKHLFFRPTSLMVVRRLIFLFSPKFLKKLNKII